MEELRVASLFCGCGGTDVGLLGGFTFLDKTYSANPFRLVYANDIESSACRIFEENFGFVPDSRDIRKISSKDIPEIDVLTGGFPCQSFSIVAQNPKRLGYKDERGMLFFEMCRILREKQPKCFIAENVKGLLSANKGEAFPLIISEFEKSGYRVTHKLVNAADFGVPQRRERVIIVGIRNDIKREFVFPEPSVSDESQQATLGMVIDNVVDEKYFFSEKAVKGMMAAKREMNKGRVQNLNKPCNTVGSHLAKVSLNSTDPVLLVNGRYRRFTPREVARIQSFPESFVLLESESAQYRALGNAIAPVMFWHIAKAVSALLKSKQKVKNASEDLLLLPDEISYEYKELDINNDLRDDRIIKTEFRPAVAIATAKKVYANCLAIPSSRYRSFYNGNFTSISVGLNPDDAIDFINRVGTSIKYVLVHYHTQKSVCLRKTKGVPRLVLGSACEENVFATFKSHGKKINDISLLFDLEETSLEADYAMIKPILPKKSGSSERYLPYPFYLDESMVKRKER